MYAHARGAPSFFTTSIKQSKNGPFKKKIFFYTVKNFPQEIENIREIIENMSEIF